MVIFYNFIKSGRLLIIHYSECCKKELELIQSFFNWIEIETKFKIYEEEEFISFSKGKNHPVLSDEKDRILGTGFYGIVRYMENKKRDE
ncbi:MAG: hypothetical protein WCG45_06265 [bacterium]